MGGGETDLHSAAAEAGRSAERLDLLSGAAAQQHRWPKISCSVAAGDAQDAESSGNGSCRAPSLGGGGVGDAGPQVARVEGGRPHVGRRR
jgi:hypothetical protein